MENRFENVSGHGQGERCGCPTASAQSGQIGLFGLAEKSSAAGGCPTAFQETAQIQFLPERRAEQGEEPGETVAPSTQPGAEAQEHVSQERRPELPTHGVGAVAQKVGQLQGLLEFLEEGFDAPAAAIQIGNGLGAPSEVIGQENHFPHFSIYLDPRHDPAQDHRIVFDRRAGQRDEIVAQNMAEGAVLKSFDDPKLQVVLGSGDPEHFAPGEVGQMRKVHVSLVEDDDFTRMDMGTKLAGADVVMLGSGADDDAAGQETLEIEPDVAFGGGLAAAMFGPVQRAGHQRDRGGVHDVEQTLFEPKGKPRRVLAGKGGLERLQMTEHGPEELFGHFRIASAVGVREGVFAGGRGPAQGRERTGVQAQGVAHVVETQSVSQLRVEQTHDMAPRPEGAGVIFHTGLPRQFGHQVGGNKIAKLTENGELAGRWLVVGSIFHALPCGRAQTRKPTFSYPSTLNPVGQE